MKTKVLITVALCFGVIGASAKAEDKLTVDQIIDDMGEALEDL